MKIETLIRRLNLSYFELGDEDKRGEIVDMLANRREYGYPEKQDIFDVLRELRAEMMR